MKNLKIGKKLFVTFGIVVLLFAVIVGVAFWGLINMNASYSYQVDKVIPVNNELNNMRRNIQASAKFVMYGITNKEKSGEYVENAQTCLSDLATGLEYLRKNSSIDTTLLDGFYDNMENSKQYKETIFNLITNGDNDKAIDIYYDSYYPVLVKANDYLLEARDYVDQRSELVQKESNAQITTTFILISVVSCIILLVIILLASYITRSLTRPIKEIATAAEEMENGNLKAIVTYQSKDELGILSNSMRKMMERISYYMGELTKGMEQLAAGDLDVKTRDKFLGDFRPVQVAIRQLIDNLNSTLGQINQSADQVAIGSDQVSSGSQALSQGATEQASSIEELAATINEISTQVKTNAQNAEQGSKLASRAGMTIEEGNRQMQELICAMTDISDKSGQISKIIKTIEDIAFQTNILALNAAVEAARAGTAGKGFAVVADEVRNLASKSAEASKSTAALIEGSISAVERGTKLADETAHTLIEVVDSTKQVVTVVDNISQASNEQASSITQVTQGIDQISNVVQTNSATAEESAAASEELSSQAQMLKKLINQFKLKESGEEQPEDTVRSREDLKQLQLTTGKY